MGIIQQRQPAATPVTLNPSAESSNEWLTGDEYWFYRRLAGISEYRLEAINQVRNFYKLPPVTRPQLQRIYRDALRTRVVWSDMRAPSHTMHIERDRLLQAIDDWHDFAGPGRVLAALSHHPAGRQ